MWSHLEHFFFFFFFFFCLPSSQISFLRHNQLSGDLPPHLVQPCKLALGEALIWGLYPDWFADFVNWVPLPRYLCSMHSFLQLTRVHITVQ